MAHYQLSYGFNSSDNSSVNANNINTNLESKNSEIPSVSNTSKSGINMPNEKKSLDKTEAEKRKLPQEPSEPGSNIYLYFIQTE